ncbi:MAG: AzlC family ABC transporter permease [Actinomycetota bacterium]
MTELRRNSIALGIAVGLIGVPFGVLAATAGLSAPKAIAMSMLVFTGASQFAAVGVIDSGGSPLSAVGSAMLLAARNGLYGMRLSTLLRRAGWRRVPGAQFVIDESTAMSLAQEGEAQQYEAFWWTGAAVFVSWNLGTFLGVLLGDIVGDPEVYGLDAAFPASFVALLGPLVPDVPARVAAIVAAAIALVAVPFTPAGLPILLAAFAVVPGLLARRRTDEIALGVDEASP